jgi:hypothetical protein
MMHRSLEEAVNNHVRDRQKRKIWLDGSF